VLVLASASPRRRALLSEAGIEHGVLPVHVDETPPPEESPLRIAIVLAERKARAAADLTPDRPVVGADTLVVLDGRILGKPATEEEAVRTLRALSGRRHEVITGLCVILGDPERHRTRAVVTEVRFRELPDEEILAYVRSGEPMDKAGAYGIQGGAGKFVAELAGSRSNVIGLPVTALREMLEP